LVCEGEASEALFLEEGEAKVKQDLPSLDLDAESAAAALALTEK
jgi:hypothetical protein